MSFPWRAWVPLLLMAWVHQAVAQQATPPTALPPVPATAFEVLATPYLWLPWTSVSVRPANTRISSTSSDIDPGQLVSHLTWAPFMGNVEFRDGPFGLDIDYLHAPLKSGVSTRNVLFHGATSGLVMDTGSAILLYRAIAQPDQDLDVGAGVSAWGLAGSIELNEGLLPAAGVANGLSWADPMVALRYHHDLRERGLARRRTAMSAALERAPMSTGS